MGYYLTGDPRKAMLEPARANSRLTQSLLLSPGDSLRFQAIANVIGKSRHSILREMMNDLFLAHSDIAKAPISEIEQMIR
jgi:hypothetical protein